MAISATYIAQSTIQISLNNTTGAGESGLTKFLTFANTVADAITGTGPSGTGPLGGVTFAVASGVTAQTTATYTYADGSTNPSTRTGWTLFDSFWGNLDGSVGVNNTSSPIYTQVFRSVNEDGTTAKNIILRYNIKAQEINTTTCQYWDTQSNYDNNITSGTLHVPTFEAWTYQDCAPVSYNLSACDFIIMVSPHWCILHSYALNEPSMWAGVVEIAREDIIDTVANKNVCWGWISSTLWCLGAAALTTRPLSQSATTTDYPLISMPLTKRSLSGVYAACAWGADYGVTAYPTWLGPATPGGSFIYYLGTGGKFATTNWDQSRRLTMPIRPIENFSGVPTNYGQIYGLKVLAPVGQNMNKVNIAVDQEGNSSVTASERGHWLLNCHWKSYDTTSWLSNTNTTIGNTPYATSEKILGMVSVGTVIYAYGLTKIMKIDAANGYLCTDISTQTTPGYTDIKYDGDRYVYVSASTATLGLQKIDIASNTVVSTYTSNGIACISISGSTICCASVTTATQPVFYLFVRQSSTGSATALGTPTTLTTTTALGETGICRDILCDFDGNFWAAPVIATTASNFRLIKIDKAGSAATIPTWTGNVYPAVISTGVALCMVDGNTLMIYGTPTAAGVMQYVQLNPRTLTVVATGATVGSTSAGGNTANSSFSVVKIQGNLLILPKNGTAIANAGFIQPLGRNVISTVAIISTLIIPLLGADIGTSFGATTADTLLWDGTRLFINTESAGLRVFTNFNGGTVNGGNPLLATVLGQVAIPA